MESRTLFYLLLYVENNNIKLANQCLVDVGYV